MYSITLEDLSFQEIFSVKFAQNDTSKPSCLHNTTLLAGLSQNNCEDRLFSVFMSVHLSVIPSLSTSIHIRIYGFDVQNFVIFFIGDFY